MLSVNALNWHCHSRKDVLTNGTKYHDVKFLECDHLIWILVKLVKDVNTHIQCFQKHDIVMNKQQQATTKK